MENKKTNMVVFSLTPMAIGYEGKTGGEVRLIEILKRLNDSAEVKIIIVSTEHKSEYYKNNSISAEFKIVKTKLKFKNILGLCLKSLFIIAKSFFVLKLDFLKKANERIFIYSSSDLFWEVIPAYIYKFKNKDIKWVQIIHHIYPDWKKRQGNKIINFFGYYLQRTSFFLIKRRADKIIVVNHLVKHSLYQIGFKKKSIFVNSNGINVDYFYKLSPNKFSYDGIFLARLSPSKGIFELIDIWKKVCIKCPSAKLALIGGGNNDIKDALLEKIKKNNLEKNIDILGFLPDEDAYPILKAGKVFVFPSHEEGWGMSIAEAMACGLPVVSWNLQNYKSVFENYTFQIEENNAELFSREVIKLLKDEKHRKNKIEEGKEFVKKYSLDMVAQNELKIINSKT